MGSLASSLMDHSRLGNNKRFGIVDCKRVIENVMSDLAALIEESGACIKVGAMPKISGYEKEIYYLFQNLILNAIKFQKRGFTAEINIKSEKVDRKWKFSVKDNGIGIPKENLDKIFEMFRLLNNDEEFQENEIGHASCKKNEEYHENKIWIESELGKGTTLHFIL